METVEAGAFAIGAADAAPAAPARLKLITGIRAAQLGTVLATPSTKAAAYAATRAAAHAHTVTAAVRRARLDLAVRPTPSSVAHAEPAGSRTKSPLGYRGDGRSLGAASGADEPRERVA